jgi:hypothetical protein
VPQCGENTEKLSSDLRAEAALTVFFGLRQNEWPHGFFVLGSSHMHTCVVAAGGLASGPGPINPRLRVVDPGALGTFAD